MTKIRWSVKENNKYITAEEYLNDRLNKSVNNNNNDNNFISMALLSYVQGALQSCKQHY